MNKGPWVLKDIGALTDGEMGSETSLRIEQKRAHQFFMDASEGELLSNKKQAVQSVSDTPISTPASANFSFLGNTSSFQSAPVHYSDRLHAPEPLGTFNFGDKDVFSLGNENVRSERSRFIKLLQNSSTVNLSMSHAGKDPSYLNAGTRGARINLAGECTSNYPFPLWNSSNIGEDNNATSLGLTYRAGIGNVISMGYNFAKEKQAASLIDNTISKVNGDCMVMGHQYSRGDSNGNFMQIPSYKKAQENFISMFPSYRKANEDCMPVDMTGNKDIGFASRIPTPDKVVEAVISAGTCSKEKSSFTSMNKFERGNISFGGFQHEPGGNNTSSYDKVISSYGLLISESSVEASESLTDRSTVEYSVDQIETVIPKSTFRTENVSKKKVQKTPKSSPNNFPSNVKSLLSTGILDGVPVKYVSWSREKSVIGIIEGTGYLCGCSDCKLSKNLNAFQFESHAACKTRHPNNHIYFETGKTIYAVVQELKNTPKEMLFEAIANITHWFSNQPEKFPNLERFDNEYESMQLFRRFIVRHRSNDANSVDYFTHYNPFCRPHYYCIQSPSKLLVFELQRIYAKNEVAKPS